MVNKYREARQALTCDRRCRQASADEAGALRIVCTVGALSLVRGGMHGRDVGGRVTIVLVVCGAGAAAEPRSPAMPADQAARGS